jgi:hypothetical protein
VNGKPGFTFPSAPLLIYVNNGAEVFTQTTYALGGPLALADFNGDGHLRCAAECSRADFGYKPRYSAHPIYFELVRWL